ncbi:MAG: phosphatidylglycerophosphatase C [Sediminicola sp.]|jgi:phosphatidylglycerophosphatase C
MRLFILFRMVFNKRLVLFDFDGTISSRDSMFHFLQYYAGKPLFYIKMVIFSPFLILLKLNLLSAKHTKELLFAFFFKGVPVKEFNKRCENYTADQLHEIIKPSALKKLKEHLESGDKVYIVSASLENWLIPWVDQFSQLGLIATSLVAMNDNYSGKISGENCKGLEKVNRLKLLENVGEYREIIAYGDSIGDKEMLEMSNRAFFRVFK